MPTHALGMHRQVGLDADLPAQTPSVGAISVVPSLHRQGGQKLINAREKAPEKLDLGARAQREHAGQRPMPTHETRATTTKWWRGNSRIERPSGYRPDETAGHSVERMHCTGQVPYSLRAGR